MSANDQPRMPSADFPVFATGEHVRPITIDLVNDHRERDLPD